MANIVFSWSEIEFCIGCCYPFFFIYVPKIILQELLLPFVINILTFRYVIAISREPNLRLPNQRAKFKL